MISRIFQRVTAKFQGWVKARTLRIHAQKSSLSKIYILPSGFGWAFVLAIICIATGAINYQLNTVLLLVFMFFIIGILSMWETNRNLKGVSISCLPIDDTQEGQPLKVMLLVRGSALTRFAIAFSFEAGDAVKLERLTKDDEQVILPMQTIQRGHFNLPVIVVATYFPFGLFRAWSYIYFDNDYFVFPQAVDPEHWPESGDNLSQKESYLSHAGEDDLYELKAIKNPWVQAGRIAWKISARGQGWYLKSMTSPTGEHWLFRIEDLISRDIELNLQQLSYWIQTAEQQGHLYGVELNGFRTEISHGKQHLQHCLRELATY